MQHIDKAIARCKHEASLAYSFNPNSYTHSLLQAILGLEFKREQEEALRYTNWAETIGEIHG